MVSLQLTRNQCNVKVCVMETQSVEEIGEGFTRLARDSCLGVEIRTFSPCGLMGNALALFLWSGDTPAGGIYKFIYYKDYTKQQDLSPEFRGYETIFNDMREVALTYFWHKRSNFTSGKDIEAYRIVESKVLEFIPDNKVAEG